MNNLKLKIKKQLDYLIKVKYKNKLIIHEFWKGLEGAQCPVV